MNRRQRHGTTRTFPSFLLALCLLSGTVFAQLAVPNDRPPQPKPSAAGANGVPLRLFPGWTFLEVGVRKTAGDTGVAKFSEYRDLPTGFFIRNLALHTELPRGGAYFDLQSRQNSEKDLNVLAGAGVPGQFKVTGTWSRLPHTEATAGRNFYVRSGPGRFTLPGQFQALQGAPVQNLTIERNSVGLGVQVTPNEAWDLRLEYSPERRTGFRPSGNTSGFTVVELPEPVQYRTSSVKASAEVAKPRWVVQASSQSSLFHNEVKALEWSGLLQPGVTGGAGRRALAPDNTAQSFAFSGALDLTQSARIVATVAPGWMRQNEAFLPFTIDPATQSRPGFPSLPAASLQGSKQTLMMNYLLSGKAGKQFAYTARYRSYRLDNETPSLRFSSYVPYDSSPSVFSEASPGSRRNLPYAYTKQNLNLEWMWEPGKTSVARWFYQWEAMDRTYREARRSNEHIGGVGWDWMNRGGWALNALIQHSRRRPEQYDPDYFLASFPAGTSAFALPQLRGLRRADQAARTRNYGTVTLQAPVTETLSASAAYTVDRSFFNESGYGALHDLNDSATGDVSYLLAPSISLFGDYTYERIRYALRSRQRLDASLAVPAYDSAGGDWESNVRDAVHTWGGGLNAGLFRNRLVADLHYGFSEGESLTATKALSRPAAGAFAPQAEDYPSVSNRFQRLAVSAKFALTNSISYRFEYAYERYRAADAALEQALPFSGLTGAGAGDALFLGMALPRYRVHIWSVSLGYVF
ncbi:MAG: MtrB/PioB family decaheme-associated outer membrane protein [Candidatus Solibacter usitatus]|nr:MtrB/PioB family decaheme-associated outer membrane protein [Candidatus Solibacter usitatus]